MRNVLTSIFVIVLFVACDSKQLFDEYQTVPGSWAKENAISFTFKSPDTTNKYNLFINLRNNNEYPFSNLHIITELEDPKKNKITDTLEYIMANPDGSWLGTGFSAIKENKLWYKEKVRFKEKGNYHLTVKHAMRKNGNVLGLDNLNGITELGFRIEKTPK